ncbi:MAG: ABC transporter ATP-binding protein [Myxococcota bacterium]
MGTSLVAYLKPHWRQFALGALLLLVTNAFDKSIPWLLRYAIDSLTAGDYRAVRDFALAVLGVAAVMWVVRTASRITVFNVGRDVEYELRGDLLARIHRLGASFFSRMRAGDIMSRATSDLGQVRLLIGFGLLNVINALFAYIAAISLMVALSPKLTLFALAPYPLFVVITRMFSRALYDRSLHSQEALGTLAEVAQESLGGIRVVRAYALEDHERARFEAANQEAVRRNMRLVVLRGFMWPVLMTVGSIGTLIVIWVGGSMVLDGELSVGEFAAFSAYLGQLVWPTLAFGYLLSVIQRGRASWGRLQAILDAEPDVAEAPDARAPRGEGGLAVRGLTYGWTEQPVLQNVSFDVPAGGSLAVVGPTGSGKSTLAGLLPRLLPTPARSVYLDGDDVTELKLRGLRRQVGFAQQEPFLFSTTVARNIGFGLDDPDAPDAPDRVRKVAREAAVLEELEGLPDGLETLVGERGVQLSGGQKQRVALARALLNEPTVLVLDDPMSAVDARTETSILQALSRAGEGRTVVLVTHRVAAAARCDRVVVIDDGRVVERGTHDELCDAGGLYARLAARQRLEQELAVL